MFYGYCKRTPYGLAYGFTKDCHSLVEAEGGAFEIYDLVPAKRGDEVVAYAIQNDADKKDGVFFTFYPGLFHRDIVAVRDFALKNAVDREVIPLTVGP